VDGYVRVFHSYANGRPPKFKPSPLTEGGARRLPAAIRNFLQELEELDARREKLRQQPLKIAPAE